MASKPIPPRMFKLQRPIATSPGVPLKVLAYDEKREMGFQMDPTDAIMTMFGNNMKIYRMCAVVDGNFIIDDKVWPDQEW